MKKTLLAASVASSLFLLSACGQQQAEQQTTAKAAEPAPAVENSQSGTRFIRCRLRRA